MTRKVPEIIEVNAQQFEELLERAASNTLRDEDTELLRQLLALYAGLFEMAGNQNTTIARLRKLMFGATSEKSEHVLGAAEDALNPAPGDGSDGDASDDATADSGTSQDDDSSRPPPGHGRLGADDYSGADQVKVRHPEHAAGDVCPADEELLRQAAQGEVLHNDDTIVRILELMGARARKTPPPDDEQHPKRTGLFTSGVVAVSSGVQMVLFFSGRRHAGENLKDVLQHRAAELAAPIQMCDGLARNLPGELETILANCLAHGRRNFVELLDRFPDECRHVIEAFQVIYHNDKVSRENKLSAEARLVYHQTHSQPTMDDLHAWLQRQFDHKLVEPNSALGDAINYLLKRWEPLTLFLRQAGAPLDNNVCERALKKAILHRKNSMFYKTSNGARVGDMYMSLIYTCELSGANPFDYLNQLQLHAADVSQQPERWMPWNYHESVAATSDAA